jgi:hypothetical protein
LNLWHDYDKLKRIGHLVAQIGAAWLLKEVESVARHDKLKHIGHLVVADWSCMVTERS